MPFEREIYRHIEETSDLLKEINRKTFEGAFGGNLTLEPTPIYKVKNVNNRLNGRNTETFVSGGGSVTNVDGMFSLMSGTGLLDYAVLRSKRSINYQAGTGVLSRFSCIFPSGVAGYWSLAGLGVTGNGLFFGYNGTTFSILRQTGGFGELRSLQITTPANSSETGTVTLNGTAFNISLTNAGGTASFTAYQIGEETFSGWEVEVIGDTIYFSSESTGAKSGTYSFTSTGGAVGTFSQVTAGVSETYNWISQSLWNVDKLDGTGPSNMTLDPTKGNVYEIRFQWLGFGRLDFFVEDDELGVFNLVHTIKYPNRFTEPSLRRPSLKSLFAVYSAGGTGSSINLKSGSFASFLEGKFATSDNVWGYANEKSISGGTETIILTLKNKAIQNGVVNSTEVFINNLTFASDGTKNVTIRVYLNGTKGNNTITDYTNFATIDDDSIMLVDTTSDTYTGGILIASFVLGKTDSLQTNSLKNVILSRTETLTITAESTSATDIDVAVNWIEEI